MSDAVVIIDPRDIRLERHGVIEAHAGTGKTYTIVQMVLRILEETVKDDRGQERYVHLRELLIVTYTEKAAGELKRRIREGIEKRIAAMGMDGAPGLRKHFESCLNNQHEALIGTIHSICLRLLQTWPLETGMHFDTAIVDDADGLWSALRESMRTDWQDRGTFIPLTLEQLGTPLDESLFGLIIDTAKKLLDEEHAVLDRRAAGGYSLADIVRRNEELARKIRDVEPDFIRDLDDLVGAMEKAGRCGKMDRERRQMLDHRLSRLHEMRCSQRFDPAILKDPLKVSRSKLCTQADAKKIPECADVVRFAGAVANHDLTAALRERSDLQPFLHLSLVCDAAALLAKRWNRCKREKALVSYEDMLCLMHRAVQGNGTFLPSLRSRLRFGIIDEFQDTSTVQWEIFQRIFLHGPTGDGPRLFIVGDPKQSIFSFQGANVQTFLQAKEEIINNNGRVYSLETNYRSQGEIIDGYNAIFRRNEGDGAQGEDWFLFGDKGDISYPAGGRGGGLARAAERIAPENRLEPPSVQVMALEGSVGVRQWRMGGNAARVIKTLRGTVVSIPCGMVWKEVRLDYEHFAVIVEAHQLAGAFLDRFKKEGIPAVKYKMEGVFQSPMARDLRALLNAILHREGDPAPRLAALLTHFFNRQPAEIDPEKDLEVCGAGSPCFGDTLCMAHALQEWVFYADRRQWARLFRSIQERTGVRERLIRLLDGERHLADLRQVIDYCIEKLCRDNSTLGQLVEHLGMLYKEEVSAGRDKNLHLLATDRSSVKVLTMHAAKGLEFPVVFVATGGSKGVRGGANALEWIGADGKRQVMPVRSFSRETRSTLQELTAAGEEILRQSAQERRRLLYVALTRAQALLFVPGHFDRIVRNDKGEIQWRQSELPGKNPDNDLTPRLVTLFSRGEPRVHLFDEDEWKPSTADGDGKTSVAAEVPLPELPDIRRLNLPSRICLETSYTALSRRAFSDREVDRSEEEEAADAPETTPGRPAVPGGKRTGDALHRAIEELLLLDDLAQVIGDDDYLKRHVRAHLERNGILREIEKRMPGVEPEMHAKQAEAIAVAKRYIAFALTERFELPGGGETVIAGLPRKDRI
ncbi:MAG: UvrD-helicase domain-containing protein, partial [Chitinispirillaceae bacterium]|nr:UvrD-helicase domain-containing protein [Chitinispirillaceae bacterium]